MESKKHISKDLHAQHKKFFLIGLSLSLTLVITAFEWRTIKKNNHFKEGHYPKNEEMMLVPEIKTLSAFEPVLPKQEKNTNDKKVVDPLVISITANQQQEEEFTFTVDSNDSTSSNFPTAIDEITELDTSVVVFPERNAEPLGGYKSFYESIAKEIKYPMQAKRTGTEGKVFVQFVIDQMGQSTDFKVLRRIGAGCDEEAVRVLAKTRWEPAKQRGRPVRVRMTMPVIFKLSN
ncbi:MAG: energy transducer TonB [Flammeovirgaceae bacterium]